MSKSGQVRFRDLRAVYRLIHDARDVGRDPTAWTRVLTEGMARLIHAQVGIAAEFRFDPEGRPAQAILLTDLGWPSPARRDKWYREIYQEEGFREVPIMQRYATLPGRLIACSREQFLDDASWYDSVEFNEIFRPQVVDDFLNCHARTPDHQAFFGFQFIRPDQDRRFGPSERRLTRLFMAEVDHHLGKTLAWQSPDPPFAFLPRRLRQTLECLMAGDGEKQAARRLGISRHTVHDYVKDLYRRLGVNTRAELLARCLRSDPPTPG